MGGERGISDDVLVKEFCSRWASGIKAVGIWGINRDFVNMEIKQTGR